MKAHDLLAQGFSLIVSVFRVRFLGVSAPMAMESLPERAFDLVVCFLPRHACGHYRAILREYDNADDLGEYDAGMRSLRDRCRLQGQTSCPGFHALLRTGWFACSKIGLSSITPRWARGVCARCGKTQKPEEPKYQKCACRGPRYCSQKCQRDHWEDDHKGYCWKPVLNLRNRLDEPGGPGWRWTVVSER